MTKKNLQNFLTYCIAIIWVINGLFCKLLNFVPRHQEIVAAILGGAYSRMFTILIGCAEIGMATWIVSRIHTRLNAIVQIILIAVMNALESVLVPDLLLWGRWNAVFALMLILVIYLNEFYLDKKLVQSY